jgi:hypothetical protein
MALTELQQRNIKVAADQAAGQFRTAAEEGKIRVGSDNLPAPEVEAAVAGLVDDDLVLKVSKGVYELTGDGWIRATKIVL